MNESQKLRLKRELYNTDNYILSLDSSTGEVINLDFNAIDKGMYRRQSMTYTIEQKNLNKLKKGFKVVLGV